MATVWWMMNGRLTKKFIKETHVTETFTKIS